MIRARESKAGPVGVLSKVLQVLEALDAAPAGLQLRQVAHNTGINKSTAYRFLAHLESEGYLFRDDDGAYIVAPKLARLGAGMAYHATLRHCARPVMQRLWSMTTETVNLGVLDGLTVLYLDVMESTHSFRMVSEIGMRRPLYCTSLGKSMLAFVEDRDSALQSMRLERVGPHTITSQARLRRELAKIAQQGFAVDDEEAGLGSRCVGAPIFDQSGKVTAAISVSGPITRINRDRLMVFARAVREGALSVSAKLGYSRQQQAAEAVASGRQSKAGAAASA
jgi:IclR family acetate operon transcriptional repressor